MGEIEHLKSDCMLHIIHATCAQMRNAEAGHLARHASWGGGSYAGKSLPRTVGRTPRKTG